MSSEEQLTVLIGTYHSAVAQFNFDLEAGSCERQWVDTSSTRAIKAVAFNGFFGVFGGNDEMIRIVNSVNEKQVGLLYEHESSITHLQFHRNTHLLSSSDDGKIYIWEIGGIHSDADPNTPKKKTKSKYKSWDTRCTLIGHKSSVQCFSIHPSGRLLLSIDGMNHLKIWDLIRARCIVTIDMPMPALGVEWSPDGYTYAIVRQNKVLIYTKEGVLYKVLRNFYATEEARATHKTKFIDTSANILAFTYILHDVVAIADWAGRITIYDLDSKSLLFECSGHTYTDADGASKQQIVNFDERDSNAAASKTMSEGSDANAKIRSLRATAVNGVVYLISADNRGRICVYDIHSCLNAMIVAGSDATALQTTAEPMDTSDLSHSDDDADAITDAFTAAKAPSKATKKKSFAAMLKISGNDDESISDHPSDDEFDFTDIPDSVLLQMVDESDETASVKDIIKQTTKNTDEAYDIDNADSDDDDDNADSDANIDIVSGENATDKSMSFERNALGYLQFTPSIQVDTDTRLTCLDVGVLGKSNAMYKWKKPKTGENSEENAEEISSPVKIGVAGVGGDIGGSGQKRSLEDMRKGDNSDMDDDMVVKAPPAKKQKKNKKKKRGKNKKPVLDLSRFD